MNEGEYEVTLTRDEMRHCCYAHKIAADAIRAEFGLDDNTDTWQLPPAHRIAWDSHHGAHLTFKGILTRTAGGEHGVSR